MNTPKNKFIRYSKLIALIDNWPTYLFKKLLGFKEAFTFNIRGFGHLKVGHKMLGAFRENFFDDIYFRHLPSHLFAGVKNPVIVDVGANVGYFSLATFSKYPEAKIVAFEPHPYCYSVLEGYNNDFSSFNWTINRLAMSGEKGIIEFHTDSVDAYTTLAGTHKEAGNEVIQVEAVKLDEYLRSENIESLDLLKLDCEGAEYSILYNLPSVFFEQIRGLVVETHKSSRSREDIHSLNDYLVGMGYTSIKQDEDDTGYIWAWRA